LAATERARWLFELAHAIDEAQWVASELGAGTGHNPEALELYGRLEAARAEVEALRGRLTGRTEPPGHGGDPSAAWDVRSKRKPDDQAPSGSR
jgi:hypothetical protein